MDENYVINRKHIDLIRKAKQLTARNARHENNYTVLNEQYILPLIITICTVLCSQILTEFNSPVAIFA